MYLYFLLSAMKISKLPFMIYLYYCICNSFISLLHYNLLGEYTTIYLFLCQRTFGCFQFFAIMNIQWYIELFCIYVFVCLLVYRLKGMQDIYLGVELLGYNNICIFSFIAFIVSSNRLLFFYSFNWGDIYITSN